MADTVFTEREFRFRFPDTVCVTPLDKEVVQKPQGMCLVDFVVQHAQNRFFIEVKDPSCSKAPERERLNFAEKMRGNALIAEELVPKARDSFCFLYLMELDTAPALFVFLVGLRNVPFDRSLLGAFKDRLLKRLRREADEPWKRQYVSDCLVLSEKTWNTAFPEVSLTIETK